VRQTFIFGLERVRELREHAEARAKEDLAATLHQRLKGAALLAAASEAVTAAAAEGSPQAGARQSAGDLLAHERWLHALRREHEDAAVSLDRLDTEVDARRSALGDASRERGILEKLKERQAAEHRTRAARREGAELDEVALNMHQRRASGR
jgi:flagellar FliJ protein